MTKIYVGAGHGKPYPGDSSGTYDPGAVSGKYVEEKLNEAVCSAAAVALRRCGFEVKADANAEQYDYVQAVAVANAFGADYAMEIHHNAGGGSGTMMLVASPVSTSTRMAAEAIGTEVAKALGHKWQGVVSRDREYFNRATNMPSSIPEIAYVDSAADEAIMDRPGYAARVGEAIAKGLCTHFGKHYVAPAPPKPPEPAKPTQGVKMLHFVKHPTGSQIYSIGPDGRFIHLDPTTWGNMKAAAAASGVSVVLYTAGQAWFDRMVATYGDPVE